MSYSIDSRFVPILNLWNNYLKDNGSVEFLNDDEDDEGNTLLVKYEKYKDIPPAFTLFDNMIMYKLLLCSPTQVLEEFIIPQTKRLIAGYKKSKEYKESKYYKMDIVKQRIDDIEEDFKDE